MFSKTDHVPLIYEIARGKAKAGQLNNYLELGIALGACFNKVAPLAKKAFAVDTNPDSKERVSNTPSEFFLGTTDDFFLCLGPTIYQHERFDLIFIDANHQKEFVKNDFLNSYERLASNGLIIIHDTYPPNKEHTKPELCGDGWKFVHNEIRGRYELVILPFYFGLTIVRRPDVDHFLWTKEERESI